MAGIKWYSTPNDLGKRCIKYGDDQIDALVNRMDVRSLEIQAHMKRARPWNDRTGEARIKLHSEGVKEGDKAVIYLVTRAPHGVFLEQVLFRYAGRLEIIRPTMDMYAQRIMNELKGAYRA